ncbi:MAG: alcohol dehydrogenase catalytic domain-containing protein, partial [Candidatus Methanoperedenaceae archaeon]|nr:alcohol dehydrogenase catalytic domain-containing protein [Candidatus Methanoperedenaceae archaeon]
MKTAVYYNNNDIRIEERPIPEIKDGEILVKVKASGICGTDLMEWYRIKKAPRVLGHEMTGEIVESKSEKFKVGQRVFVSHHVPCNQCKYCLSGNHTACETLHKGNYDPGGFSEFVRVPRINVEKGTYVLPENVYYEEGTMIEPLACVVRAHRIIGKSEGQTVLVMGSGVSGLLNIQMAKLKKANVIATDITEYRLNRAKEFGADEVHNANEDLDIKADRIVMCTGALPAFEAAFKYIDRKGIIMLFAIPNKNISIPTEDFWRNELALVSSYGAAPVDLEAALELIKDGKINVRDMITDRVKLDDIQKGFKIA